MAENIINIGGRFHDTSINHTVTGANEILDDDLKKKQSVINAEQVEINQNLDHRTKMAHIRIDAEEETRANVDNQLNAEINAKQLEIGAVETDTEPIPESPNMLPSGAVAFNLGWYYGNRNPLWIYAITDAAGRFLAGIKANGEIEWSVGVPSPVKNYVDTHLEELLALIEGELATKVDKVEGKSLIDADYAEGIEYIQSVQFIDVKLDANGKILEATKADGTKLYGAGVELGGTAKVSGEVDLDAATVSSIDNVEYLDVWLDLQGRIIMGLKKDGTVFYGAGVPKQVLDYVENNFVNGTNEEYGDYLSIIIDANEKIVSYRKKDGTLVEYAGIETPYIKVKKLEAEDISGISDNVSLPDYYFEDDYLDDKVMDVRNAMATMNGVSFGFVTDPHVAKKLPSEDAASTGGNAGYSGAILKYVMDRLAIPFVLNGGDIPVVRADGWEPILGAAIKWHDMMSAVGKDRVFNTRGNHDYLGFTALSGNWAECGRSCTPKELYPIIMGDNHIYDVVAPARKMYYYFDVTNVNLRVIVLDDYGDKDTPAYINGGSCIGQSQYNWLLNTALDCSNKNIILLSHQTADPTLNEGQTDVDANRTALHEILKALVNKSVLNYTSTDAHGTVTVTKDFTSDTNTFVCHLAGHQHKDASAKTDGVLSIIQTCDCYSGYRPQGNYTGRYPGTVTEQAVSIFSVDFDARTLKMTRIGGGENNEWTY